ncbi:MAG: hypothetical protein HY666_01550 [Chloroflexi bacterium]|nr:hypothetical protein [Chloroflexota bacterium]
MNIFFDVDYTIVGGADGTLRPGVSEIFQRLTQEGHNIYVWSGVGIRTYEIQKHNLNLYVSGVFEKPLANFEAKIRASGIPVYPDLVVDDYPEIVTTLGGIQVRPYSFALAHDKEMERVYNIIADYVQNGHSDDSAFRLPSPTTNPPGAS